MHHVTGQKNTLDSGFIVEKLQHGRCRAASGDYFRFAFCLVLLMTQFIMRRFKDRHPKLRRIDIAPSKDHATRKARQRFIALKRNFIILSYRINRDQVPFL